MTCCEPTPPLAPVGANAAAAAAAPELLIGVAATWLESRAAADPVRLAVSRNAVTAPPPARAIHRRGRVRGLIGVPPRVTTAQPGGRAGMGTRLLGRPPGAESNTMCPHKDLITVSKDVVGKLPLCGARIHQPPDL